MSDHLSSFMIFFPLLGAVLQVFLPLRWSATAALATSLASSVCGVILISLLDVQGDALQFVELVPWIQSYSISYFLGIHGLNILPLLLVAVIFPILIASEWPGHARVRGCRGLLLLLQGAFAGALCAQDFFLLFFFWALSALPFYFLISLWGRAKREGAAFRAVMMASVGNALFFAALLLVYYSADPHTFSLTELSGGKLAGKEFQFFGQMLSVPGAAFLLLVLGFVFRLPIWPLNGWFSDAVEEAPPSTVVALSAVSIPVALTLFLRLSYSLFPEMISSYAPWIVFVGAMNLFVGAIFSVAPGGLRHLLSSLCLGELGLGLIGIGSASVDGIVGSLFQQLVSGLALGGLGLFIGYLEKQDPLPRGGVAFQAPLLALVTSLVAVSLIGVPGMGGFVGRALIILGAYPQFPGVVLLGGVVFLFGAYCLFRMLRQVFLGPMAAGSKEFQDLGARERFYLFPLVGCLLIFGVYPKPWLEMVRPTVLAMLEAVSK